MTASETILIKRCQGGDASAINDLLSRYQNKAQRYALKMTKNTEDAADLVSEAFIRASRAIGRFRLDSSFTTWLHTILRNCFIDMRKSKSVKVVLSLDAPIEPIGAEGTTWQPIDESETPFQSASRRDYNEAVYAALQLLPYKQRTLLLMHHKEELSCEEISERLCKPVGTIKSQMNRARVNLKKLICQHPELYSQLTGELG